MNCENNKTIVVVAGEPSGDIMAAGVVRQLQKIDKTLKFIGIGGDFMEAAGVCLVANIKDMTSFGVKESLQNLRSWMRAYASLRFEAANLNVVSALLVDVPDVNLRFARAFKADGIKVFWFVGPKVWAWKKGRLALLKKRTDMVYLLFPFEKKMYDLAGVKSKYVGHPLFVDKKDELSKSDKIKIKIKHGFETDKKIVILLPGSRKSEIKNHFEVLLSVAQKLKRNNIIPVFAPLRGVISKEITLQLSSKGIKMIDNNLDEILSISDAAAVASGTVTLQVAKAVVPMCIYYKLDSLSYFIAQNFLDIPYVGLPNWILGKEIIPELLQNDFNDEKLLTKILQLLSPENCKKQKQDLKDISQMNPSGDVYLKIANCMLKKCAK